MLAGPWGNVFTRNRPLPPLTRRRSVDTRPGSSETRSPNREAAGERRAPRWPAAARRPCAHRHAEGEPRHRQQGRAAEHRAKRGRELAVADRPEAAVTLTGPESVSLASTWQPPAASSIATQLQICCRRRAGRARGETGAASAARRRGTGGRPRNGGSPRARRQAVRAGSAASSHWASRPPGTPRRASPSR